MARKLKVNLIERMKRLAEYSEKSPFNRAEMGDTKVGVIASGICYYYAKEVFGENASYLKLGFTNPLPAGLIREFCSKVEKVYILEENDPYIEEFVRQQGIDCIGKDLFPLTGEMTPDVIRECITGTPAKTIEFDRSKLIARAPSFCAGCPHRGLFYRLGKRKDIMISGENDEGEPNKATVGSILSMIRKLGTEAVPGDYHWNYFNEESDDVTPETSYTSIDTPVTPFNNHLKYTTDWTQHTANTIYDNVDDVITAVLTIIAKDDETKPTTVAQILSNSFNLFTADNLNKIADLTKKLYDNFDASLVNLIGTVLGCDLTKWVGLHYTDEEIYDADTFTAGLYEIVEPLSRVLDWLLFGESYGFFVEDKDSGSDGTPAKTLINVGGAEGYIYESFVCYHLHRRGRQDLPEGSP